MKRSLPLVLLVLLTFFVISFLTNIIGPLVPEIIEDFDLSLTLVALLPFAFFIAYGVMTIPAGMLVEVLGEKRVMVIAFLVAYAGAQLFALLPSYGVAVASLFLIGSGMAMLQVVINPLLRAAGGEEHFAFNSVIGQLCFGAASFLSPWVYSYLVQNIGTPEASGVVALLGSLVPEELPWVSLYWIFAVVSLLMVAVIAAARIPRVELQEDERPGPLAVHLELLRNPKVVLFFLGIFCYVGAEQGVANWMSEFLSTRHGYDPQTTGAAAVAWFWGMMTAGTLLGLVLLKLFDSRYVLVTFTAGAMLSLALALYGPGNVALLAFPAIGFLSAVMYPIIFSLALNSVTENHGSFSGILVTGIFGGAVVPLIVGSLGDAFGLRNGMLFLFITFGYILSIGLWARPIITNKTLDLFGDRDS
jgi:FHS family L-fucose permease-like MFS transporter